MSNEEQITESVAVLESVADHLRDLSHSFFDTGNEMMGKRLSLMAADISEHSELIRQASRNITFERFQDAEQSSFNLLEALIRAPEIVEANRRFADMGADLDHLQSVDPNDPKSPQAIVDAQLDEGA